MLRNLWDNFKHTNIQIIQVPEGEEKEQEIGNLFEKIMKENFPNWVKEIDMQVQESQRVPNKMDPERTTPRYIINKIPKVALAGVAQWIEFWPVNQRVAGSIPSQGTCQCCRPGSP